MNVPCLRSWHRESSGTRSIPEVKLCQASTWKGDRLEIPFVVDCFFFYYTFDLLWLFHIRCLVSSSERKNQIVDTIGTLLHHILGEFYRRIPCFLFTVFVTYFLEIREKA